MRTLRAIVVEAALVIVIGGVFALVANFVSPRGLPLGRDYAHSKTKPLVVPVSTNTGAAVSGTNTNTMSAFEKLAARLKSRGLQVVDSNQVARLFRDPRYEAEWIIFVDARGDQEYKEGHIPGAYQLDYDGNRLPDYMMPILAASVNAEKVVVYCNGGNCETSEFAALSLKDANVPAQKLFVYPGGFTEWSTNGLPIEVGARKSGKLREEKK
ncbi:MAG: rhodanese-like domain-containing protein [Verrucomicrobia bacterium]|nr:rhodanese-like domain-containing protein [Verrucomicrobiota bacterium]